MLSRVAELVTEVAVSLREHGSVELATLFDDYRFQLKAFYLADIFSPTLVTWDVQTWLVTWGVCAPQSKNSIYGESNNF